MSAASEFFVHAPVAVMPASWQDTGSGVFRGRRRELVLFGLGPLRDEPGARLALLARCSAASAAFLVDVYLY